MPPDATLQVPASLMTLLSSFAPLFTGPSFRTFTMLACGFLAQPGKPTVCGMLFGAGLSRLWPHDRAHWFFSRARWDAGELCLAAAKLVVALLVPAGEPVLVAIDDTLFKRRGKKVWAASWFHDGPRRAGTRPAAATTGRCWPSWCGCRSAPGPSRCPCWRNSWSRARAHPRGCGWPAAWPKGSLTRCPAAASTSPPIPPTPALAGPPPSLPRPLHPDRFLLDQPGRTLVRLPHRPEDPPRCAQVRPVPRGRHPRLGGHLERGAHQERRALLAPRGYFTGFCPAISAKAKKAKGKQIRDWHLNRRSGTDLSGLAKEINPQVPLAQLLRSLLPLRVVFPGIAHQRAPGPVGQVQVQAIPREVRQSDDLAAEGVSVQAWPVRPLAAHRVYLSRTVGAG